jgi:transcriptional regulator with XRE-family HTH domain
MSQVGQQLGQRIRELRRALSYTQEQLAEKANISVSFLSMIERAERVPHVETLAVLSNALGVTLSQIFDGVNEPGNDNKVLLPLTVYLEKLPLGSGDVEALLLIAKTIFKDKA